MIVVIVVLVWLIVSDYQSPESYVGPVLASVQNVEAHCPTAPVEFLAERPARR